MTEHHQRLAILVGGGPAPGINSVIAAATIRTRLEGMDVVGVRDGFEWLMQGDVDHTIPLTIEAVSRIHFRGGSHLGIARANPTTDPRLLDQTVNSLLRLNVTQLITIGGGDTAFSAVRPEKHAARAIPGVPPPQTIDNHLAQPALNDTLRYPTARPAPKPHPPPPRPAGALPPLPPRSPPPLRCGHRQEPDGRREDDVALVLRRRDGAQGGAPRARHRQVGRRDRHADR